MSTGIIRKATSSGDTILARWDVADPGSVEHAREVFEAEARHGLMAICDEGTDLVAEQIRTFDPEAREILAFGPIAGG